MKSWFKGLAATAIVTVLAGCAGGKYEALQGSIPPIAQGNGRIYFYQPQPTNLAAAQQKMRVNGEVVGRNKPGAFFFVDRPAGSYVVTNLYWTGDGVSFMLDPGQTRYIRVMAEVYGATGAVGKLSMHLVDPPELAENEMRGLRYWGAASPERVPGL
ncbi:Protein of uncharacterised function (DUF2846) [Achromobacter spanius]|uniref:DUF2846 domain-containing protein n=1 Tax=Achromobacter spanius TaxID=217203 RepID=UPI000C2BB3F7|nr:DUF2846 domain-containing protein [Achromobacter spanius]AUA57601.1 hypothetical protein CVS48_17205 [Achromobacter spanius]CAB3627853.1 hypothetical protein LMG5911_00658 [Achromobacter spanius]SPT41451.1 Protein of uncharacterised function (DUF2846) [Achromobacter denitrificans]VEE54662.1 Protein of uncharacterised function (DUF2846) [Achromobacter spanius]